MSARKKAAPSKTTPKRASKNRMEAILKKAGIDLGKKTLKLTNDQRRVLLGQLIDALSIIMGNYWQATVKQLKTSPIGFTKAAESALHQFYLGARENRIHEIKDLLKRRDLTPAHFASLIQLASPLASSRAKRSSRSSRVILGKTVKKAA